MSILDEAREVMHAEASALMATIDNLDEQFERAMRMLRGRKGKIVVTGVGKSGLIGQKIAATLSSTGSVAVFMHAADAAHGDLGVVEPGDIVIALSHSGETEEALYIVPAVQRIGAKVIALVGTRNSRLAQRADVTVQLVAPREADHLNLAPTSSALVALAIGDAIAVLLSKWRKFRHEDFAMYHPGGLLGRRLLLRVADLMIPIEKVSTLSATDNIHAVAEGLTRKPTGAALVVAARGGKLAGVITDGDLRRAMHAREKEFFGLSARDLMTTKPTTVLPEAAATEGLRLMEDRPRQISVLPVVDAKGKAMGVLRLHDLLQIGFRSKS